MPASTTVLRNTWPKIREILVKGDTFYQVDARRQGTTGKRQAFGKLEDAEAHAAQVLTDLANQKREQERFEMAGLDLTKRTRAQAVEAEELLKPLGVSILEAVTIFVDGSKALAKFGKNISDATAFYALHLEAEAKRQESATVDALAEQWEPFKHTNGNKVLRKDTLARIFHTPVDRVEKFRRPPLKAARRCRGGSFRLVGAGCGHTAPPPLQRRHRGQRLVRTQAELKARHAPRKTA